ncbi:hypothetical protein HGB24_01575 [Candidatus Saccharibacteria bacterium]|nr:hypothetical protein [Candidatus Saccharibacteria bacterium]
MEDNQISNPSNQTEQSDDQVATSENSSKATAVGRAKSGHGFAKVILHLIIVLIIGGAVYGLYYWRDNQARTKETDLNNQIASLQSELKAKNTTTTSNSEETANNTCVLTVPTASLVENVEASINSGNTAALEGYMASSVTSVLAASEAGGQATPSQAVANITSFIQGSEGWDFNLPTSVLNAYDAGEYGQYFSSNSTVGKASDTKVISFSYDCNNKINMVLMSQSSDLLN